MAVKETNVIVIVILIFYWMMILRSVQMVVNSSDKDINLGNVQFRNYLEKHEIN